MSWKILNSETKWCNQFDSQIILAMGNRSRSEIPIEHTLCAIHSQIILDDEYLFHIYNHKVQVYYQNFEYVFKSQKVTANYEKEINLSSYKIDENQIYTCFQSNQFQNILIKIRETFFDFYSFHLKSDHISENDLIKYAIQLCTKEILNEDNVFEASTRLLFKNLIWCIWAHIFHQGILTPALLNPEISEIMVNGKNQIYFEIDGKLKKSSISFLNSNELNAIIERLCTSVGRRIDESTPYCDARMIEGHRIHAIIPPLSLTGPCLTIRKFPKLSYTIDSLIQKESIKNDCVQILKQAIISKNNILISGGTSSGKTTLLNCLSAFIPNSERVITIEDSAELQLQKPHVIRLECRHENIEKQGKISVRDLVKNSLRMRPDRIIVGECRGEEALDMLQAMNTGHNGSMTTIHANSAINALNRLETLCLFSEVNLPIEAIRQQISNAIDLVVHQSKLPSGKRIVTAIEKITGYDALSKKIITQNLYLYED